MEKVEVLSTWQTTGYENPNYCNINYSFPVDPPYVPMENPVGIYQREFNVEDSKKNIYIVYEGVSRHPYFGYTLKKEVLANGNMNFCLDGKIKENCIWMPRLGFEFALKKRNASFEYFGMGTMENYCDTNHYSTVNCYQSCSKGECVNYIRPQEHGHHTCVRELNIKDNMTFKANKTFDCNVSLYGIEQLQKAEHTNEIGCLPLHMFALTIKTQE